MIRQIKSWLPPGLKLWLRQSQRQWRDYRSGLHHDFVNRQAPHSVHPEHIRLAQPIRSNPWSANKVENLRIAIAPINGRLIAPGQVFAFWQLVPPPTTRNGYQAGRNLVGNQLGQAIGGGLCQLSGILYHLALLGGLDILERHPHSQDIYTEATRYTPLGCDAAVVFGYKDLRFRNPHPYPISFRFELSDTELVAMLCAPEPLEARQLRFKSRMENAKQIIGQVFYQLSDGSLQRISEDAYKKWQAKPDSPPHRGN